MELWSILSEAARLVWDTKAGAAGKLVAEGRSPILAVRTPPVKGKEENESLSVTEQAGLMPYQTLTNLTVQS